MSSAEEQDCTQPDPFATWKASDVTLDLGYCVSCVTLQEGSKKSS